MLCLLCLLRLLQGHAVPAEMHGRACLLPVATAQGAVPAALLAPYTPLLAVLNQTQLGA